MEDKAGIQIGKRAFFSSFFVLLALMVLAGILTMVVPAGEFERADVDGRTVIITESYQTVDKPDYPFWRWLTAPAEVITIGPDRLTLGVLVIFIMLMAAAFAILDKSGILGGMIAGIVRRYGARKYTLLMIVTFVFMLMGALFGIMEEAVMLLPMMLALSYRMGWDALVGLGMSMLALNMGFSAAITNPFTIGLAQKLADLPMFSGSWLRVLAFGLFYAVFYVFISRYARKIERDPKASLIYGEDDQMRQRYANRTLDEQTLGKSIRRSAYLWLTVFLVLFMVVLVTAPFVPAISDVSLPIVAILFLIGGIGAGWLAGLRGKAAWHAVREGIGGLLPGIPLILMAASVKYIAATGMILDTILERAAQSFAGLTPSVGAIAMFFVALILEVFISSATAKAFLLIPLLLPLADLISLNRQIAVTAYCFGDGFSNMAYPTNALLLLVLGVSMISIPKWLRWTAPLWGVVFLLSIVVLLFAVAIGYGPY